MCGRMLGKARRYLCSLVVRFVHLSTEEAAKIGGILVSIKCSRTTQVSMHAGTVWRKVLQKMGLQDDGALYSMSQSCSPNIHLTKNATQQYSHSPYPDLLTLLGEREAERLHVPNPGSSALLYNGRLHRGVWSTTVQLPGGGRRC